ncbi:MAG: hypothetical protein CMP10_19750 [Zetaproteobacteria bacterium]|nr:hypothetical protein [Pseudobdellovibrionaceae bacterium]
MNTNALMHPCAKNGLILSIVLVMNACTPEYKMMRHKLTGVSNQEVLPKEDGLIKPTIPEVKSECDLLDESGYPASEGNSLFAGIKFSGFCLNQDLTEEEHARAERGLEYIYSGKAFRGVGMPLSSAQTLRELQAQQPPSQIPQINTTTQDGAYKVFGTIPSPMSRPPVSLGEAEVPVQNMGDSVYIYKNSAVSAGNCVSCHSGVVDGRIVSGLMNSQIDQYAQRLNMMGLLQAAPALLSANQQAIDDGVPTAPMDRQILSSFVNRLQDNLTLVFDSAETKGDNLGAYAIWRAISRYAEDGINGIDVSQETELDTLWEGIRLPTVDSNPWWHYKYKDTIYRYSDKSADFANHFSFTFSNASPDANENRPEQYETLKDVLTYINQLNSPVYDKEIDLKKAKLGEEYYNGTKRLASGDALYCISCHGRYEQTDDGLAVSYIDRGLFEVGTDRAYSDFLLDVAKPITDVRLPELAEFFAETPELIPQWEVPAGQGYHASPLDGVWASAPYFHNGSVPTLYQTLNSQARPAIWERDPNPSSYDHNEVGLVYKEVSVTVLQEKAATAAVSHPFSEEAVDYRNIYNTTNHGKGNQGHYFGDMMNDTERYAVIEYLKTIGGKTANK